MKVLFVTPACQDRRITDEDARVVPIGLYYLAALLLENGHRAQILNLAQFDNTRVQGRNPDQGPGKGRHQDPVPPADPVAVFKAFIQKEQPEVIGFSVTNPSRINAAACAKAARTLLPGVTILFGGPAPTFMADHLFSACPQVDFIIKGEGEQACLALVNALEAGDKKSIKQIPGLTFREKGRTVSTGPASLVADLDDLPHPSAWFTYRHLSMSRGCPGSCTFCGSPKFWGTRRVRFHSPQWFAREVTALAQKGVTHFYISDDTFTMDRDRVMAFCDLLLQSGVRVTWNAISRVDYLDPELVKQMRRAGCIQISFGVESGSDLIKRKLGKPVANETAVRAFHMTAAHGILPRAYFIYGSPGETAETIQESIDLMLQLKPLGAIFYLLVLFPGTALYSHARRKGLVADEIWHGEVEDLPWFELDDHLDFNRVQGFGESLRHAFYTHLETFAADIVLEDDPDLYPLHADFLSRLAMTFSHGEYARDSRVKDASGTARALFEKSLRYHPDLRAFLGLGMGFQQQKDFNRAIPVLEKGLAHYPGNKNLSLCLGICHMNLGAFDRAGQYLLPFETHPDVAPYLDICRKKMKETP